MAERADGRARPARKTAKAPDAFRTISEASEEIDLPQHVLRFWETRFTHIRPLKRGGGRRLYRPDHIALLRGIRALLYEDGMTIKGAQKVLRDRGVKTVIARGAGNDLPEIASGDVSERLTKLKKLTDAAERNQPIPPGRIRESIERLEEILVRLELN